MQLTMVEAGGIEPPNRLLDKGPGAYQGRPRY